MWTQLGRLSSSGQCCQRFSSIAGAAAMHTLTTWHCPHSPAAATDGYLPPTRPTAASLGGKMSWKPSKWLFDIKKGGRHERNWREFCHWIYFYLRSKHILMALLGGGRSSPAPPWIRHWLGFSQSKSYTCWQHLAVKSTSRLQLYLVHYGKRAFTRTSCPSMNKSAVQSRLASGTSPLKLIAKTLRYQDASFPTWNCQIEYRPHKAVGGFAAEGPC